MAEFEAEPQPCLRVLVIRLGALGDFVLSFPAFAAIRAHHPGARVTLLTTAPFAGLGRLAPWFDEVVVDARPRAWDLAGLWRLRRALRGFGLVYDLQTSGRSGRYFRLAGRPAWSGVAAGCSLPHADPGRDALHTIERQAGQLRDAGVGVGAFAWPELSWLVAAGRAPALPGRYAVLVPGAAPHRPGKRWPAARFAEVGRELAARGMVPVVVGGAGDAALAAEVAAGCAGAVDLAGRTDLAGLAAVLAGAEVVVGNDTGPMHLAAALGRRCVVLFGGESDPALTAPRGAQPGQVRVVRAGDLRGLGVAEVAAALERGNEGWRQGRVLPAREPW
ncbi:MAG: glycosyltransferase family 9 protein [Janthinobacterium lividum]